MTVSLMQILKFNQIELMEFGVAAEAAFVGM